MPKWKYALEPGGDKSLEISRGPFRWQKKIEVRLNGDLIGAFPDQKELANGQALQLPDGTTLRVQFVRTFFAQGFRLLRNDRPLPGSVPDPTTTRFANSVGSIYFIAGLNILLGFAAMIFQMAGIEHVLGDPEIATRVNFLQTTGFGIIPVATGFLFLVLALFTQRRSLVALIIAVVLYGLESVSVLFSNIQMLIISASNASSSLHLFGEVLMRESVRVGLLGGGIVLSIALLMEMGRGIDAVNKLRKGTPPAISDGKRMSPAWSLLLGAIIGAFVGLALVLAYGNGAIGGGVSIDERNAAASAAVPYESGADFVEALERGVGVPCTKHTVTPLVASGIHVADSVTCMYSEGDLVNAFARVAVRGQQHLLLHLLRS